MSSLIATFPVVVHGSNGVDYARKLDALRQYGNGAKLRAIKETAGLSRQHLGYLIDRIQKIGVDGQPLGHRALLLCYQAQREYPPDKLTAGKPVPGSLQALFALHPTLREAMVDLVVHGRLPGAKEAVRREAITSAIRNRVFWNECEKLGLRAPMFPFVGKLQGAKALRLWALRTIKEYEQAQRRSEDRRKADDPWFSSSELPSRFFERVECDGQSQDVDWLLEVPSLRGDGILRYTVSRLWLIALIEVKSTAILGYTVAFTTNYSACDVARAVRSALVPWTPRELTVAGMSYKPGEGLPNGVATELAYVCWDEMWLDSWRANWADLSLTHMERMVSSLTVVGAVAEPDARPHAEGTFNLLSRAIELVKKRSKDASEGKNARSLVIPLVALLDFLDVLIARFNASPAPGASEARTEILRRSVNRAPTVVRRVPEGLKERCAKYDVFDMARITEDGGRVQVWWKDARYTGSGLHQRTNLIGKTVFVETTSEDPRWIDVTLVDDGTPLGTLEIERRFRSAPHELSTHRAASDESRVNGFLAQSADLAIALTQHLSRSRCRGQPTLHALAHAAIEQGLVPTAARGSRRTGAAPPGRSGNVIPLHQPASRGSALIDLEDLEDASNLGPSY